LRAAPPLDKAKRGLEGRDEEIATVCTLIENMGRLGIPVWCYEWMAVFNWMRTSLGVPARGGAMVTGYDNDLMRDAPLTEAGIVTEEQLWENLEYFLKKVIPVAEKWNVQLAMHPDDPPLSPIRGVGRIMRSVENFQRLLDLVPSPINGITLCQGNFRLMTDDLPATIRHFGKQKKIFFVHLRDVRGTPEKFVETFHDDGTNRPAGVSARLPRDRLRGRAATRSCAYDGGRGQPHTPATNRWVRLFAIGYIKGLREAAYRD